jgi:2-polyprenyl-3-methyl-5-hydroxy-6-metoxy-1,4-benzoquinol methylase
MDPQYGERYRELFERHWWWRARTELIVDTLTAMQRDRFGNILDIGCGDGLFFERLAPFGEVEGVEPDSGLVRADNPFRSRIHIAPFDDNFRPGKRYGLVLMLDVLEHMKVAVAGLRHAVNLLHQDGVLIATVPALMTLWTNHDTLNHHYVRYTRRTFSDLARRAGLQIRQQRYLYHWTCPVKLGIRFLERVAGTTPKPPQVPQTFLNLALFYLTRLEQSTLSRLPMPFGSSLMVVGKKAA